MQASSHSLQFQNVSYDSAAYFFLYSMVKLLLYGG